MAANIPSQIQVQVVKAGWFKRSYQFIADGKTIGQLNYVESFANKAIAIVQDKEIAIRRGGFWKRYIEITSTSHPQYNMRIDISWTNKLKITDSARNSYEFKPTNLWTTKWAWVGRNERPLIEIRSKIFSRQTRGQIEIKDPEMKDCLFWIIVAWFVILCSESDAAAA